MSHNQSRADRSESTQYRKTGRSGSSNQQRNFSGGIPTKGGGGGGPSAPSIPASRSFKKSNNNAQGGQSRGRSWNVESDSAAHAIQSDPHEQQPTHISSTTSSNVKMTDAPTQKTSPAVPRVPSSNVPTGAPTSNLSASNSQSGAPTTPAKGDASRSFPLQFGSISPGLMNGVQIPARTSSAPPNLDEQKKDQARQDLLRAPPPVLNPSLPKQQLLKKDAGARDQINAGEAQSMSKSKRDAQVSAAPPIPQTQKPAVHPISGMPMQLPYHQSQIPVQFGGPNHQIQSQALPGTSLPLPMQIPLPIGNPSMQQPMFISGLQPHPMQSQAMMHQGQNFNFSSQMGHQLPPQLGNMGMNMTPQFPQQQAGKFSGSRKPVKITHPETHEELMLDGSSGPRSHPNVPPQSQPIQSFTHPMQFFPNSYNANPIYFPAGSVPMNTAQVPPTSQPPRFYNQVKVTQPVGSHGEKEASLATSSISVGKAESLDSSKVYGEDSVRPQKDVEPPPSISLPQSNAGLGTSSASVVSGSINLESDAHSTPDSVSAPMNGSVPTSTSSADEARNVVGPDSIKNRPNEPVASIKDKPNQPGNRGKQDQIGRQSTPLSSLPSQLSEAEAVKRKPTLSRTNLVPGTAKESLSTTVATPFEASNLTSEGSVEGKTGDTSVILGTKGVDCRKSEPEIIERKEQGVMVSEILNFGNSPLDNPELTNKIEKSSDQGVTSSISGLLECMDEQPEESLGCCSDDVKISDNVVACTQTVGGGNAGNSAGDDKNSSSDTLPSVPDNICTREAIATKLDAVNQDSAPVLVPSPPDGTLRLENEDTDNSNGTLVFPSASIKDKVLSDANVAKTSVPPRGKKKKKELFRKAEAAGTSSDLYNAYKGPEEKKENIISAESMEETSSISIKQTSAEVSQENDVSSEKPALSKMEPDDWEDAAEISPQLKTAKNEKVDSDGDGNGLMTKRYSRDFLLKFVGQCTDLPEGFEVTSDIADALMVSNILHESYPSPGRNIDRSAGGPRPDRRAGGLGDEDKWNKMPGSVMPMPGRGDIRADVGYAGNIMGFRPGQGGNYGVLRNPRAQAHVQGILSGPMQSLTPQGVLQRNNSDSDRWQRGTGFQKVLMLSPQSLLPVMHKAEKKYEVGKVTDEEQAKQRQLKGILNKLTPQNFEKLFQQVKEVNIDNVVTLAGVISQIFDKALMEPTFCEMYADFCFHLAADLPDLSVDNERITFKRLLLNKCQEEFERGEREEEEANKVEEDGEGKQTEEEREEKRLQVRRRMLGNIRLIGELYKKKMLTERIMHECINKLFGQNQDPDEENIEALCKLMSTIGEMIDHLKAKDHMDYYFDIMKQLSINMKLSSRVRFMLKDAIDLRKNKWQQRRKVEGPKKIEEVHRDAAQERQAQASRLARPPSMGGSIRRGPPVDFSPRAPSMLPSPGSQIGGFRGVSPQLRNYGSQDARMEERNSFENRTMPLPLPQRSPGDDSITLGPQGGLVRGMAFRGQSSTPNINLAEMSNPADARRTGPGLNGFSPMPDRTGYGQREDFMLRYAPDRFATPSSYDQHQQDRSVPYGTRENRNVDRSFDRSMPTSPSARGGPPTSNQNISLEKVMPEEYLRDKSMDTIKEFYSARDENEVALCIKDLNTPSFYPSMISIWVADSFERKDMERDLLTKLLINLTKPRDGMITDDQLTKGFESVLAVLEDAINDAPRAAEFLGRIFARVILESIVSLSEIGRLIYEGGEEQGRLVETGLAAEVVGTILDTIKSEKGDSVLKEIRSSSNLRLEEFRPPGSNKSLIIDKFM